MKTVTQTIVGIDDDPLVHVVGALNDEHIPHYVSVRTMCGQYLHCEPFELSDARHATCVVCAGPLPGWYVVAKQLGASSVRWKGSSLRLDLKLL